MTACRSITAAILSLALLAACGGDGEPAAVPAETVASPLAGAAAYRICGGETDFLPQFAAAAAFGSVWVACRTSGVVERVDAESGAVLARIPAPGAVALAADESAVWAVERETGTVYRIDPEANEVAAEASFGRDTPYVWAAAGAVWLGFGEESAIGRLDPGTMELAGTVEVGDGASDLVEDDSGLLVICHRDSTLWRVDPAGGSAELLAELPGDTPERLALADGRLWATGRGTDLLRVDPATGETLATVEIGTGGIDLAVADGSVWVAVAEPEADRQGLPVLERLVGVDPATGEETEAVAASAPLNANGLAAAPDGSLWIADVVAGLLVRAR